jgi:hypothetical protein
MVAAEPSTADEPETNGRHGVPSMGMSKPGICFSVAP